MRLILIACMSHDRKNCNIFTYLCFEQQEVVALDAVDTLHCDHLMHRFKLQPQDLRVVLPSYFAREKEQEIKEVRSKNS